MDEKQNKNPSDARDGFSNANTPLQKQITV